MTNEQERAVQTCIREAGGIVHGDGNIFFTNAELFHKAALSHLSDAQKKEGPSGLFDNRATMCRESWLDGEMKSFVSEKLIESKDARKSMGWKPWGYFPDLPTPSASAEAVPSEFADVFGELAKATAKFPTWPTDPLHALAVLGEEFGELTKDMLQMVYEPHKTSRENVRKEALQTAAMALRLFASLDRYEYTPREQHSQEAQ